MMFKRLYDEQDEQDAEEAREERIDAEAAVIAKRLVLEEEFCGEALIELGWEPMSAILRDVGTFAARFEAADTDRSMAEAGYTLWRYLRPYIEAAAKYQAESDARTEIERQDAMSRADADEAREAA